MSVTKMPLKKPAPPWFLSPDYQSLLEVSLRILPFHLLFQMREWNHHMCSPQGLTGYKTLLVAMKNSSSRGKEMTFYPVCSINSTILTAHRGSAFSITPSVCNKIRKMRCSEPKDRLSSIILFPVTDSMKTNLKLPANS